MIPLLLPNVVEMLLGASLVLAASVWIGGFIAIMVVNVSTHAVLTGPDRLERGAFTARILRAVIGLASLGLFVLAFVAIGVQG